MARCCDLVAQHIIGVHLNKRDEFGMTPLFEACHIGHVNCVFYLLENGAIPDEARKHEYSPFDCICARLDTAYTVVHGDREHVSVREAMDCIKKMIDYGANPHKNENSPFAILNDEMKKVITDYYEEKLAYDIKHPD